MRSYFLRCALGGAVIASLAITATASANQGDPCNALTGDADNTITKIYIENGDTQEPLVKKIGKALLAAPPGEKVRIIYRNRPTCQIRDTIFKGQRMVNAYDGAPADGKLRTVRYIPDGDFDVTKAAPSCTVAEPDAGNPTLGEPIVLGIGATYISSCTALAKPADVGVFDGPIQAYGFITHKDSAQNAITAEEGYLAYGFAEGAGEAAPWTIQNLRFKRGDTASTTLTMAAALRLKPAEMLTSDPKGVTTSEILMDNVSNATNVNAVLGILGTELYDAKRGQNNIKLLAFKSFGQRLAWFPDKTNETFDKQNVRDGHYLPWSPTPYMGKIAGGVLSDANAKRIYDIVMGTGADPKSILPVIQSGLVPECAMKVTRSGDGADLTKAPDTLASCGCYFEANVPKGTTSCATCETDATCNGGKCRLGYCEAK